MRASFTVPPELSATAPPEARGLARDQVRLLVARERGIRHLRFRDLPSALRRGDLVVVNTSDTEPAALDAHRATGRRVVLHLSTPANRDPDARGATPLPPAGRGPGARGSGPQGARVGHPGRERFVVELRTPDGRRVADGTAGEQIRLPRGVTATLLAGYPDPGVPTGSRLWLAEIPVEGGVHAFLRAAGRPIGYSYLRQRPPLGSYRTIFATPGDEFQSAEMPSAARPFTPAVLDGLRACGVGVAEIVLHTGVSSPEAGEVPLPERYRVPPAAAAAVNAARAAGGRVVAVGTTVTRALETVADTGGSVHPGAGWTDLVLGPDRPARVVDGLVTGWHEPEASHLLLLDAVAGTRLVARAYAAALDRGYLWHEFGDSCLLLPSRPARSVVRRAR